jgi:LysM repeat protein
MRRYFSILTITIALILLFTLAALQPVRPVQAERVVAGHAGDAAQQLPSPSPTPLVIMPVITVTPMPDGSMIHVVQPGQSLWAIAIAYGVKISDLVKLNNQLSPTNPVIYTGQKIFVRGTSIPTASPTVTDTSFPVTRTPTLTKTPRAPTRTFAPTRTPAPTITVVNYPDLPAFQSPNRHALGVGLVTICVLGLLVVVISSVKKK